eukprot:622175-Pyramimonas_sp.AAC.1
MWQPGNHKYPFRPCIHLLRLWWRRTELPEHATGPAMAGRARGAAFQMAMKIRKHAWIEMLGFAVRWKDMNY